MLSTKTMKFNLHDGGRQDAGFKGTAGDCVTRAIAIATGIPYKEVYRELQERTREFARTSRSKAAKRAGKGGGLRGTTPRNGVYRKVYQPYLESLGWKWVPAMQVGKGCTVHLNEKELPRRRLIVAIAKHLTCVIDGELYDAFDCSQPRVSSWIDGAGKFQSKRTDRCVYGYFIKR